MNPAITAAVLAAQGSEAPNLARDAADILTFLKAEFGTQAADLSSHFNH